MAVLSTASPQLLIFQRIITILVINLNLLLCDNLQI